MPQSLSADRASCSPFVGRPIKILVVDDDRDVVDTLKLLFELHGGTTHVAFDGVEAVRLAEELRPEIILLDIGLPRMNGLEACRRIRQHAWGRSMVIVALTGFGQDKDYAKSEESGFDMHLVKPVDPELLLTVLAATPPSQAPVRG
jgi:CheY-like chemotaxis protein